MFNIKERKKKISYQLKISIFVIVHTILVGIDFSSS